MIHCVFLQKLLNKNLTTEILNLIRKMNKFDRSTVLFEPMNTFLSLSDDGPTTCIFQRIINDLWNKKIKLEEVLSPFRKEFKFKSMELSSLLDSYRESSKKKKNSHEQLVKLSVSKWIFFTNQLEFCGLKTEQDTKECLYKNIKKTNKNSEKEVLQMFDVLNESYKCIESPMKVAPHIIDIVTLKNYHSTMFKDILKGEEGKFRKGGVEADNLDGTKHKYPHHEYVEINIKHLLGVVHRLSKDLDKIDLRILPLFFHHLQAF
jgi:hypothetical protein